MSVEATTWAWRWTHPEMTPLRKAVLVRIGDHASADGTDAWPAIETLVKHTCGSRRGVQDAIKFLESIGALEVAYKAGKHGTNNYTVKPPKPGNDCTVQPAHGAVAATDVAMSDAERGNGCTRTIQNRPEPSSSRAADVDDTDAGTEPHELTLVPPPEGGDTLTVEFEDFWEHYPNHRSGRPRAEKAFRKAAAGLRGGALEQHCQGVADGLSRWRRYWKAKQKDPEFIPYATTWLNDHRWTEDPFAGTDTRSRGAR